MNTNSGQSVGAAASTAAGLCTSCGDCGTSQSGQCQSPPSVPRFELQPETCERQLTIPFGGSSTNPGEPAG